VRCTTLAMVVASLIWCQGRATAQPPVAAADVTSSHGLAYKNARASALSYGDAAFAQLVNSLKAQESSLADRIVGNALQYRRDHKGASREFDELLASAIANPDRRSVGGLPRYPVGDLVRKDHLYDPLLFEALLKGSDLPGGCRWELLPPLGSEGWGYAAALEPCLALLEVDAAPLNEVSATVLHLALLFPDGRVAPAFARAYKKSRRAHPNVIWLRTAIVGHLDRLGGPMSLQALRELREFERAELRREKLAPWDDAAATERVEATTRALVSAENRPPKGLLPVSDQELATLRTAHAESRQAMERRRLWGCLTTAIDRLQRDLDGA